MGGGGDGILFLWLHINCPLNLSLGTDLFAMFFILFLVAAAAVFFFYAALNRKKHDHFSVQQYALKCVWL